jgi:hypothetical protein
MGIAVRFWPEIARFSCRIKSPIQYQVPRFMFMMSWLFPLVLEVMDFVALGSRRQASQDLGG